MAKTTISTADVTRLRANHHTIEDIRLNIYRPETIAIATINATPSTNPVSELVVTGTITATQIGQRFIITDASDNIVAHGTLRKATSGQTLYISPVSIGDSGYVQPIRRAISAGDTITIYADRPLWGDYSRIVGGTFRKKWDVNYTDENSNPPPIANSGVSQSARVQVGNTANFTLPRDGANSSIVFGSKTISSYLWALPTGVTLGSGYATSDAVIEVEASVGQHIIGLTVTDSSSKVHTAYMYLFVSDGVNYLDVFDEFSASIESDTQDVNGRSIAFTIYGTNVEDEILPGAYVHLQHDSLFDGSPMATGVDVDTFVGYVTDYQYSHNGDYGQARITVVSPYLYLQRVYMPSQLITEVGSPNNWTQITSALSNPRGALSYIRWQCQNLFSMHDIDAPYDAPRKYSYEYNGKTVSSGLDVSAHAVAGNVGCASDGTIVLRKNPNHENNAFRNALNVGFTVTADDVTAPLDHPVSVIVPYADIRAGAFAYAGGGISGVKAWYGVKRWSQGASETVLPDFTIPASESLNGVLEKVGHIAANAQYPDEQPLVFNGNINVFDPAYMIWYRLNIPAEYDPRGQGWDNDRFMPTRVNRVWDLENLTLVTQAQIKVETFGQKADEWVIGSANTVMSGFWVTQLGLDYTPTTNDFSVLSNVAIVYNTSGNIAITQTFSNANPVWFSLDPFIEGNACDVCYDFNSAFFTSGFSLEQPLSAYVVSVSGTTLYVYRIFDIKASNIEIELVTTYTMADDSCETEARIQCSAETGTLAVVAWHDQTGIEFGRTVDGGANWSAKANVGSATTDTVNDNAPIGLYISGVNQVVTGFDGVDYGAYLATTASGSFGKLTNSVDNTAPIPMITGDGDSTLYVATQDSADIWLEYRVDFDTGYSGYVVTGGQAGGGTGTLSNINDTHVGNPGNCAGMDLEADTGYVITTLAVTITIPATDITKVECDSWYSLPGTLRGTTPVLFTVSTNIAGGSFTHESINGDADDPIVLDSGETWIRSTRTSNQFGVTEVNALLLVTASGGDSYDILGGELRIDNIKIYDVTGTPVDPALYKVTTYTATDAWTDVSPAADSVPQLPYGLGVDVADSANIELATTSGATPTYWQSANTAGTWSDNGASNYRAIKRIGNAILYGGAGTLDLSLDSGATVENKLGNLDVTWGTIGTIKNILVVGAS